MSLLPIEFPAGDNAVPSDASLARNLDVLRDRIARTCGRCGREPSSVQLIAVTKGVDALMVRKAVALGISDLGENRVQEALLKQRTLAEGEGSRVKGERPSPSPDAPVRWHLIGHLQRNKADDAAQCFDMIHSVDSLRLADALEDCASKRGRTVDALVQVNVAGEATKFGCRPEEAIELAGRVAAQPHLRLRGLMTIAPHADDPEQVRPHFRALRALRDILQSRSPGPLSLSMGMSGDFEVAIEEGADLIRIGTALFGPRLVP